jgi:hypothetical protein
VKTASISCPPTISSIARFSNSMTHLTFTGTTGFAYGVQCSSNMLAWETIATNVMGTNGMYLFDDSSAVAPGERFYRILWP